MPTPQHAPVPAAPTVDAAAATNLGRVAAVGAAALCIGSFLPWVTAASVLGSISKNGIEGDGILTAGAGAASAIVLYLASTKAHRRGFLLGSVFAVLGGLVAALNYFDVSNSIGDISSEYVVGKVGIGLYVCIGGALVAVVAGMMARGKTPKKSETTTGGSGPSPS
jgi:hypothetical protein